MIPFDFTSLRGTVIERPNRFMVVVEHERKLIDCHLHDPGRLTELIYPGNHVLFRRAKGIRTDYSITAAWKGTDWILTDSRFHNTIGRKFLSQSAKAEVLLGRSRIDFLDGDRYVEVKGCSLEEGSVAKFPDAPSVRASRHIHELTSVRDSEMKAMVMFLVFSPKAHVFMPNLETDPDFSSAFFEALENGMDAVALKFETTTDGIRFLGRIPIMQPD